MLDPACEELIKREGVQVLSTKAARDKLGCVSSTAENSLDRGRGDDEHYDLEIDWTA
jgi:hypothetical protein